MLPLVAALVRLRSLWADVDMWLPVFALCTPLGVQLFVSVTAVRDVSPQAVRRRAYREHFCRTCLTGLTCPTRQCDTPAARLPRRRVAKQPKPGRTGSRSNIGVRYTRRSEPIKKSARDGCIRLRARLRRTRGYLISTKAAQRGSCDTPAARRTGPCRGIFKGREAP